MWNVWGLCLDYFFFIWMSSCPSITVEKTVLSQLNCLCSFVKDQWTIFVWLFLGSLFCLTDICVCSFSNICCLFYGSFQVGLHHSNFFGTVLAIWGLWPFHINFIISLLIFINKLVEILIGLHWIYRSSWMELTANFIVFQLKFIIFFHLYLARVC